jgi:hypothetical protein
MRELEVVYAQGYRDLGTGRARTEADYYEKLNQYRLCLQMLDIRSADPRGLNVQFPAGLSPETNPKATTFWKTAPPEEGDTALPQILDYVVEEVLRTESLFRVFTAACNQFNRLNAKLEANTSNDPFWKPTGPPS